MLTTPAEVNFNVMKDNIPEHLHTYSDGSTAEEFVLKTSQAAATIDPIGGYITSWSVLNPQTQKHTDILYRGTVKKRSGIPVLFPYFGKAKHTRQHGFGRDSTWKVMNAATDSITLGLSSSEISSEFAREYPYPFEAELQVSLDMSGSLNYRFSVINTGTENLPVSPGLHPYWSINHPEKKNIAAPQLDGFDARSVDWDSNPPDIEYPFNRSCEIVFPDRRITIEDTSPDSPKVRYLVVWSQPVSAPDHDFVCIEPVCGGNYAIDESPILISPNETWIMDLSFSVSL